MIPLLLGYQGDIDAAAQTHHKPPEWSEQGRKEIVCSTSKQERKKERKKSWDCLAAQARKKEKKILRLFCSTKHESLRLFAA